MGRLLHRAIKVTSLLIVLALTVAIAGCGTKTNPAQKTGKKHHNTSRLEPKAKSVLACRFSNYMEFKDAAWEHLPKIGIKNVFISVPPPGEVEALEKKLAKHGLTVVVMRGDADLSKPSSLDQLATQLATCEKMGVKYMFLSPKRHGAEKEIIYKRLRKLGDIAKKHNVIVALETHPDLGTNGDIHLQTMKAVNHPNIRVNFDTGNIHYYNKDADAPTELKKIIDYVATVEIKDQNGQYKTWNFPALGKGVVDIPGVLKILAKHHYHGPLTMELEGIKGIKRNLAMIEKDISDSAAYLRSLDTFKSLTNQNHVKLPDYFVLVCYFVLMLGIGIYFYRFMRGMKDYFSGGNKIPWWLSGVSFYMSSFSVTAFITYPALCFTYGFVGITLLWVAVPATIFSVFLFAGKWRRARIDSPVEYIENRYSPALRQIFAWQGIPVKLVDDGIKLVSIGIFISATLGFDLKLSMIASGIIIMAYTLMGGLWAVTITDFVQFIVLTVALIIVLPLSISKAVSETTGFKALFDKTPDGFFSFTCPEFGWSYVIPLILLYCLAWSSINWSLIQRYYCVPTEKDAHKTGWLVVALYIIGPPLMFIPAMAAIHFLGGIPAKEVYPRLCVELLPAGMVGLIIAAMFSATMSMLSSDYNVCASVLTNDIYRRLVCPKASQKKLVLIGRFMTLLMGAGALGVAIMISGGSGEDLFRTMVTLFGIATAPVAIPMLLGLLSKKVTNLSALIGFTAGITVGLGLFFLSRVGGKVEFLGMVWNPKTKEILFLGIMWKLEIVLFTITALVTFVTMILVTLLLPIQREELDRVEKFHRRLETPIGQLEEDRVASDGISAFSPFRVVGISIICIGLIMLGVLFWIRISLPFFMDLVLSVALLVIGGILTWFSSTHSQHSTAQGNNSDQETSGNKDS